jgi:hypothetical protein
LPKECAFAADRRRVPQRSEDEAEVVADCSEDDVGSGGGAAFEMAAAEMTIGLHVADHGFDGGAAPELALDHAEDAALLS